ncbi:MAG: hypothetical protein ACRDGA_12400 [Bacteroidota bacterium]
MPFPSVAGAAPSEQTATTMSHPVTLPPDIVSGNLLIIDFHISQTTNDGNGPATPSGWTKFIISNGTANGGYDTEGQRSDLFYRVADGNEVSPLTITTGGNRRSTAVALRIINHNSLIAPQISAGAAAGSGQSNPASLTPSGGPKDFLWLALGSAAITGITQFDPPTNYTFIVGSFADDTVNQLTLGSRALNATTEDPGTFTHNSAAWHGFTIAVHPSLAVVNRKRLLMGLGK